MWSGNECRFGRRRCSSLSLISRRLPEAAQRINLSHRGLGLIQRLVEAFPERKRIKERTRQGSSREPPADKRSGSTSLYTKTAFVAFPHHKALCAIWPRDRRSSVISVSLW